MTDPILFDFGNELTEPVHETLYEALMPALLERMDSELQVMASTYALAFALGAFLTFIEDRLRVTDCDELLDEYVRNIRQARDRWRADRERQDGATVN